MRHGYHSLRERVKEKIDEKITGKITESASMEPVSHHHREAV
jgi:hypothetical protein